MTPFDHTIPDLSTRNNLSRAQAAEFLTDKGYPVAKTTLQKLASVGGGPVYRKFGHRVVYRPEDLMAWVDSKMSGPISSTSELRQEGNHGRR